MGLLDLFRPRWKHSDPTVRAEAIKDFSADDLPRLAQVARHDSDARVRRIALKKISDPELLGELAKHDPDEGLRRDAGEKANELLLAAALSDEDEADSLAALLKLSAPRQLVEVACKAASAEVRRGALERLTDERSLIEVARRSGDGELRKRAATKIVSPDGLRDLLLSDVNKELGLQVLGRLNDRERLLEVEKKARNKTLRSAARDKLGSEPTPVRSSPKAAPTVAVVATSDPAQAQREKLCQSLEVAAKSSDPTDFADADDLLSQVRAEWQSASGQPTAALRKRFDRAVSRYVERRDLLVKKPLKREALPVAVHIQAAVAPKPDKTPEQLAAEKAAAELAAAERATKLAAENAAAEEARQRVEAARSRRELERKQRDAEHAEKLQAESAKRAAEEKQRSDQQQQNLARVEEHCDRLEKLGQATVIKPKQLEQALKQAHEVMVQANPLPRERASAIRQRYDAARAALVIKLQELRESEDWQRWANLPRLEALCVKVEALATALEGGAARAEVQSQLKALQSDWKAVGPAPKEKSELLWQRFKAKGDELYDKLRAGTDEERTQNLAKKEELCGRIDALAKSLAENPDRKAVAEQLKALQAEWKTVGPVPTREQADALWLRFKTAADTVYGEQKAHYAELDEERGENLKKKEALCQKVEALIYATDWKATGDLIKGYQADWKASGPAPRAEQEALWLRFRAACDKFFERRQAAFQELDDERAENLKKKEALCEQAATLLANEALDQAAAESEIKRLQSEWKRIGPAPKEQGEEQWQRFRGIADQIFGRGRHYEPAPGTDDGSKFSSHKLPLQAVLARLQSGSSAESTEAGPTAAATTAAAPTAEATTAASTTSPSSDPRAAHSWEDAAASTWEDIDREVSGNTPEPSPSSISKR